MNTQYSQRSTNQPQNQTNVASTQRPQQQMNSF